MADSFNISNNNSAPAGRSKALYQSEGVREVRSRAQFLEQVQTPQEQAGLKRLSRLIAQDTDFNEAAPRGFYLNIRV
tara:strand:+ start:114944 stop:115174 length:231 start_codon:yes stop_codon:yes gene_type:complete